MNKKLFIFAASTVLLTAGCNLTKHEAASGGSVKPVQVNAAEQKAASDSTAFDGDKAFALLKKQVDFGFRVPGTKAHEQTLDFIKAELQKNVDRVELQPFKYSYNGKEVAMTNVLGFINPKAQKQIIICAHWDSRPTADQDVEIDKKNQPIPGADDGASGVAVLLELARVLKQHLPKTGVILAFFDGEDYGKDINHMLLGARFFAKHLPTPRPQRGILIDMIGDANLDLTRDANSIKADPELLKRIYEIAYQLGYGKEFPMNTLSNIEDDHIPLIQAGIPTIDLIDFDYAYWHTTEDTADKCSPRSLKVIGSVLETYLNEQ